MKNLALEALKSMEKLRTFKDSHYDADDVLEFGVDFLCQLFQECELSKERFDEDEEPSSISQRRQVKPRGRLKHEGRPKDLHLQNVKLKNQMDASFGTGSTSNNQQ